ncbi:MAG: hypothetical protein ACR2NU_16655, partial [Aeoliella sp.]
MEDQEQLERIAEQADEEAARKKALSELCRLRPGHTEPRALWYLATRGGIFGTLGIALAGAALGTLAIPVVGMVVGFFEGAFVGATCAAGGASMFVATRGRVAMPFAMAWAGAAAGVVGAGTISTYHVNQLVVTLDSIRLLETGILSVCGAAGGCWMTKMGLRGIHLSQGRGTRSWWQFGVIDLLLITTWLAIVSTLIKLLASLRPWG